MVSYELLIIPETCNLKLETFFYRLALAKTNNNN